MIIDKFQFFHSIIVGVVATVSTAQFAYGDVIGIDFGGTSNNDNYNEYIYNSGIIAVATTGGDVVAGVQFEATGLAVNGSNREIGNSGLATGADVWGDYCYSNVANQMVTLRFTGLDDSLTYDFFGGQDRDTGAENLDSNYLLTTGTTTGTDSFLSDATINHGYGAIADISPVGGAIAITITPVDDDDGNEWIGVAVVTLSTDDAFTPPISSSDLDVGTTIGVDFSANGGTATHWNTLSSLNGDLAAGTLTDTSGLLVNYVGLNTSGATGQGNPTASSASYPTIPTEAQDDWWYEANASGVMMFEFTGLDDGLVYELVIGSYRPDAIDAQIDNGNTTWSVGGSTQTTDILDAIGSYVTFSGLSSSGGVLTIRSHSSGGNDVGVVSALQLTATAGTPVGPPPRPSPVLPSEEVAVIFDPVEADGTVTVDDLDDMTIGGVWTASLSDVSKFEDNSGGFAYVMDAGNAEGDFIELALDAGLDFSSNEIAINFQMLGSRSSGSGDKDITLIGYDGATEVFRLNYVSHTTNTQNSLTVTTDDGDESMGYTPLKAIAQPTLPSGFQDFRIELSNGHVYFSGSSLTAQDGAAMNSTSTLTSLRWEVTGTSTENQGFWLDDLMIRDQPAIAPRAVMDRPNVIFILMDDMGFKDVSCYGATVVDTPNIDSLASGGLQFTDFHTGSSICSPSRAAYLTGAYPQRCGLPYGINENRESHWFMGLSPNEITLAEQFRNRGYKTMMIGKWHLGSEDLFSYYNQGFEHYYGAPSNLAHNQEFLDETEHVFNVSNDAAESRLSSLYTQRVREHIRDYRDRPFFLFYSHQYPHTPYTEGNAFDGSTGSGTRADVLKEVDWSVGQLVVELEANGILENTLLVFASDNGATSNTYCQPYRGTKFVTWEGGHRVPFILYWKGQIQTPAVLDTPQVVAMDLFPTLCEIIGEPLPTDRVYDGVSLVPLFSGGLIDRDADEPFYYYNNENLQAVRQGDWKLHIPRTAEERPFWDSQGAHNEYRLYNLATDESESNDVSGGNPGIVAELTALADAIEPLFGAYMSRGSEQRETGSLFSDVRIVQNLSDWNSNLLTDAERGRGRTLYNQNGIALGRSFIDGSTLPGGWQYLESSEANGGIETALTPSVAVGTEGNTGFSGFDLAAVLGSADVGSFVIGTGNGGNSAAAGTDLLIAPDDNDSRDFVIVRYTVSEGDVGLGHIAANISGSFRDLVGGTSDASVSVHVFHNSAELFSATGSAGQLLQVDGTFNLSDVIVAAGDTIDFAVGSNGDHMGDEVALRSTLSFSQPTEEVHDLSLESASTLDLIEGSLRFGFRGTPSFSYWVEKTTDLTDSESWEVVDEIPFLPSSDYQVHVQTDKNEAKSFWRIRTN